MHTELTRVNYTDGAYALFDQGKPVFIRYNTGDEIHLTHKDGQVIVLRVKTHDGVEWVNPNPEKAYLPYQDTNILMEQ